MTTSGTLGEFLLACRAGVDPDDAGIATVGTRRRVPGLRREEVAQLAGVSVAYLRLISGNYPYDPHLAGLVGELGMKDADFAAMWASGRVGECTSGTKRLNHPLVGELTVDFQIWLQADSPDHRLEVYSPTDDASQNALARLGDDTHSAPPVLPGQESNLRR